MNNSTFVVFTGTVSVKQNIAGYLALIKPLIVFMVLIATLCGMYIGQKELPNISLVVWTLVGVGFAAAGAAILNNYFDRDIDNIMVRTSKRPLPSGTINPRNALLLGITASVMSAAVTYIFVNPVALAFTVAAIFIYVVPYTILAKRKTPLATFIGGAGGALPPVIGYAAVKPELDIQAFVLFLIIFTWQHPHFWSLALKYKGEYEKARVNNLPVAKGVQVTKRNIALWASMLAPVSTLPYFLGMTGNLYLFSAVVTGVWFLSMSLRFLYSDKKVMMSLSFFSIVHLPLLYCMMVVDLK